MTIKKAVNAQDIVRETFQHYLDDAGWSLGHTYEADVKKLMGDIFLLVRHIILPLI